MKKEPETIVLGVTGGIAAYKSAELCSLLTKTGYAVQVVMTENATRFVTPLTFETLSRRRVIVSLWDSPEWRPEHVALADRADLFVCAPCTANFIGKYAGGIADDALTTFALTYRGPVLLAPAMNPAMYAAAALQANLKLLTERGVHFCGPAAGHVACGADGIGRMEEPKRIFDAAMALLSAAGAEA